MVLKKNIDRAAIKDYYNNNISIKTVNGESTFGLKLSESRGGEMR